MANGDRSGGFDQFLDALDSEAKRFGIVDAYESRPLGVAVADVRRRRGRLADEIESGYREVMLVERDGVLLWETSGDRPISRSGMRRRRGSLRSGVPAGRVLTEVSVPLLEPNEYLRSLEDTDKKLNPACENGIRLVKRSGRRFAPAASGAVNGARRTLLLVHGTFASAQHLLDEFAATEEGAKYLSDAVATYDQVLVFDHPTLSVSPFINGLDLARSMAGCSGAIDVIAHSRGGVVARWWLEVFGDALTGASVRAVLVGAPLKGTNLAAPNRIQPVLSLLSNVGQFVGKTLGVAAAANPFALASFALLKFIVRREKTRWGFPPVESIGSRPSIDAAVAVIPGLQGQSAVSNNFELARLRSAAARPQLQYFAVTADFEPEKIGWQLWKVLANVGDRVPNAVADKIFPMANDLVVDTAHMTSLGDKRDIAVADCLPFGQQATVHHCNYFRQPQTIVQLRQWLA